MRFILILCLLFPMLAQAQLDGLPEGSADQPIEIESDSLSVNRPKNTATFSGNVEAVQGDITLRSQEMVVYYRDKKVADTEQNAVSRIDVNGDVFLATPNETAKGKRGVYNVDNALITLIGDVVITQGENIVKGDMLTHNLKTGKSQIISEDSPSLAPGEAKSKGRVRGIFVPESKPKQ